MFLFIGEYTLEIGKQCEDLNTSHVLIYLEKDVKLTATFYI